MLLLKKLGRSVLAICCFLIGVFCYSLVLAPINLPFLLKLPADADTVFAAVFALVFACVATVISRAKWCLEEDMLRTEDGKLGSLLRCVLASREWIADVIVFAAYDLVLATVIGVTSEAPWYTVAAGVAMLVVGGALAFGVLDCLLYVLARKRGERKLKKRKRR